MQPAGNYFAKLKSGVYTKAKTTTTMQMAVIFEVTHMAEGGEWAPLPLPVERTIYLAFTDGAQQYTDAKLIALGFDGNFATPGFSDEAKFEGIELICRHEPNRDNKVTEKWDIAKWGGERTIEAAPADACRQAAAAWKARTVKSAPPAGRPTAPPAAPARSAPPPPAAAPAPSAGGVATATKPTTKDAAWAAVTEAWAGKDDSARNEAWSQTLARVLSGKPETALKPEEWAAIAEECSIPF